MTAHLVAPLIGLALLATMTTACGASTARASTATGEGSALARESTVALAKGELIGTGVGAAAGAIYVVKKRSSR